MRHSESLPLKQSHKGALMHIEVTHNPDQTFIDNRNIGNWPIWTKDISEFPWSYDEQEQCYFLEGEVTVTPEGGTGVTVKKGDFVVFPKGMNCTWLVSSPVKKHYKFG